MKHHKCKVCFTHHVSGPCPPAVLKMLLENAEPVRTSAIPTLVRQRRNPGRATPSREAEDPARAVGATDGSEVVANAAAGESPVPASKATLRQRRWREAHPEKAKAAMAKWRNANRERYNAYMRTYMAKRRKP